MSEKPLPLHMQTTNIKLAASFEGRCFDEKSPLDRKSSVFILKDTSLL